MKQYGECKEKKRLHKKFSYRQNCHGIITVMVCLLMVPVVTITAVLVDAARMKMYSSQASMSADAYAQAILSNYDYVLKDIYGLFSVSQISDVVSTFDGELADYATESFNPNKSGGKFTGFMPYKDSDAQFMYEKVSDSSLSNQNVLMSQIADFMKYRIVQVLLENTDILENIGQMGGKSEALEAADARDDLTDSCEDAGKAIQEYFEVLEKINDYPSYIGSHQKEKAFSDYSQKIRDLVDSDDYKDSYSNYHYYMQNKDAIEEAVQKKNQNKPLTTQEQSYVDFHEEFEDDEDFGDDIDGILESLKNDASTYGDHSSKYEKLKTNFSSIEKQIDDLKGKAENATKKVEKLAEDLEAYREKVDKVPDETTKARMKKEVENLDKVVQQKDNFMAIYKAITETHDCKQMNKDNTSDLDQKIAELQEVVDDIKDAEIDPYDDDRWDGMPKTISFQWYSFRQDYDSFWKDLAALCDDNSSNGKKSAADSEKNRIKGEKEKAEKELEEKAAAEEQGLRSIGALSGELNLATAETKKVDGLQSLLTDFNLSNLGQLGIEFMDRLLVTTYDFEMFTCRVTGKPKPDDDSNKKSGGNSGNTETQPNAETDPNSNSDPNKMVEYTLTGVEKSTDVNYLYKSELEYLFGGKTDSGENLKHTRNWICGIQTTANFLATFMISELNQAINTGAEAIAALTGPFAPITFVVVSGLLRLGAAALMTVVDWSILSERGKIVVFKDSIDDIGKELAQKLSSLIGNGQNVAGKDAEPDGFKLSYENYLLLLIFFGTSDSTLLARTSDLITLNVNQARLEDSKKATGLADGKKLDFKMVNTITAIKATCKVKADFVVVPKTFAQWFLSDTGGQDIINSVEDTYFGYSLIRGY